MLTNDDLPGLRGATIVDAQICRRSEREVLRLRLADGTIVAIEGSGLNALEESSIEWSSP